MKKSHLRMKNQKEGLEDMKSKIPYYDIIEDTQKGYPFIINIGGRQIGKTYSTFKYIMDNDLSFVYLRRKDKHLKKCCTFKGNPFKPINEDSGQHWFFKYAQETYTIYKGVENIGENEEKAEERGISMMSSSKSPRIDGYQMRRTSFLTLWSQSTLIGN